MRFRQDRREFLRCAGGGLAGLALAGRATAAPSGDRSPNILFLFTDDQRFSTLNALNNPEVQTPTMDRLVRNGTAFTRAGIMGGTIGAVCAPSRAMLMTGQTLFHVDRSIIRPAQSRPEQRRPFHLFPEVLRQRAMRRSPPASGTTARSCGRAVFRAAKTSSSAACRITCRCRSADFDPRANTWRSGGSAQEVFERVVQRLGHRIPEVPRQGEAVSGLCRLYGPARPAHGAARNMRTCTRRRQVPLPENFLPEHPFDNGEMRHPG